MKRMTRNAWWLTVLAAAVLCMPAAVTGKSKVTNSRTGEAFRAYIPGVDARGELAGYLGYWSGEVHQVENGRHVRLTVRGEVPNRFGQTVRHTGFLAYILLENGETVEADKSSIVVTAEGKAMMRCSYVKPKDERGSGRR